jgi:hypothetical protein
MHLVAIIRYLITLGWFGTYLVSCVDDASFFNIQRISPET